MAEEGQRPMPQQQAKPKGMPPMKKPPGTGTASKPKVLTAPSLAKPIGSQETDMSKALPVSYGSAAWHRRAPSSKGMALHPQKVKMNRESQRPGYIPENIDNMSPRVAFDVGSGKKRAYPENIDNMSPRVAHMHGSLKPGTIKKAMAYVVKAVDPAAMGSSQADEGMGHIGKKKYRTTWSPLKGTKWPEERRAARGGKKWRDEHPEAGVV